MDPGPALGVRLGAAEHFAGDRGDLAVAEDEEADQVAEGLPSVQLK